MRYAGIATGAITNADAKLPHILLQTALQLGFMIVPDDPGQEQLNDMLSAKVIKVFDGDGFLANVWHPLRERWIERVSFRFAFIDAPETGQEYGSESQTFLEQLIGGRTLRLDPIGKQSQGYLPIDQHKRMLCMGYLTEEMQVGRVEYYFDGKCTSGLARVARPVTRNVELEMIVNGFAWVLPQYAFDREEEYFRAQENAREARRGLWALENPEPPWTFKQKKKRQKILHRDQLGLFSAKCEIDGCDGHLVERESSRGKFFGCSNFPACRFSRENGE
ncbi:thermonuclease family protein [Altererythrobacter ishigakiensis]|uniref:Endonuclease YncB(Thermonuclease family) n=1 Tax=Altererythrobacter ishigakiensis TaxID=476157 RepID=A0A562UVZ1_9SPHN|nr:thermonuclease family protein [Altererythrobacter ishigakiensis]TWJ09799.1 endonuclease YncB(thermonuclease family) [Altererythrobacter ishigakiensis]